MKAMVEARGNWQKVVAETGGRGGGGGGKPVGMFGVDVSRDCGGTIEEKFFFKMNVYDICVACCLCGWWYVFVACVRSSVEDLGARSSRALCRVGAVSQRPQTSCTPIMRRHTIAGEMRPRRGTRGGSPCNIFVGVARV